MYVRTCVRLYTLGRKFTPESNFNLLIIDKNQLLSFGQTARLDVKKFSFSIRVVDKWNSLTDTCVNCITVNNFKEYILKELKPETCTIEYYHV